MLKSLDRIKELTSTTGTGTLTLTGAESGFQAFSVLGNGTKCYYTITDVNTTDFEVGEGTYNSNTLTRDTIFESSNSGNAISLSATGSTVFVTYPAEKSSYRDIGVNRDYVASGTIIAGKPLILNTDNTVTQVAESSTTPTSFAVHSVQEINSESSDSDYVNIYDTYRNKLVAIYRKGTSPYSLHFKIGTIDTATNTITYGSQQNITTTGMHSVMAVYDEVQQATIVFYNDNTSGEGRANVITVDSSGNPTVSSAQTFSSNSISYTTAVYTGSSKTVIGYEKSSSLKSMVVSLSGTTLSFGTEANVSGTYPNNFCIGYNSDEQKVLLVHRDSGNSYYVTQELGTISGTDITYSSSVAISSSSPFPSDDRALTYDKENKKFLINMYTSNTGQVYVITISGSTITWGSAQQYSTATHSATISYNATSKSTLLAYRNTSNNYPIARIVTLSGSTVTYGTETQISTTNVTGNIVATSPLGAKSIVSYVDNSNNNYDGVLVTMPVASVTTTNLTNDNYFGIASSTASTTEPVGVNRAGSFNNDQTGMTAGKDMYVTDAGLIKERTTTTTTTNSDISSSDGNEIASLQNNENDISVAYDTVNNKIGVFYTANSTNYPTIAIGSESNNSITWGTPVVVKSANTPQNYSGQKLAFGNGIFVATYVATGEGLLKAGVYSGTNSITLGSEIRPTTDTIYSKGGDIGYNPNANKFVYAFPENNTSSIKLFLITNSSTTLTTGNSATMTMGYSSDNKIMWNEYDPDTNKQVIMTDHLYGSEGRIYQASISGANITVPSTYYAITDEATDELGSKALSYDPDNDKWILFKANTGNVLRANVLTASGDTFTSGTVTQLSSQYMRFLAPYYDTEQNKTVLAYNKRTSPYNGEIGFVTISGTTPSFTASSTSIGNQTTERSQGFASLYNPDTKSGIVVGATPQSSPKAVGFVLYYGTTSSTVVNGSQFVGTARSGTDLELAEPPTELVAMANGAITKGKPVIVRTDGDFSEIISSSSPVVSPETQQVSTSPNNEDKFYVTNNGSGTIAVISISSASAYLVIGTDDGTSITWGSPVTLSTSAVVGCSVYYDSNEDKFIATYTSSSNTVKSRIVTYSGTTATASTESSSMSIDNTTIYGIASDYNTTNNIGYVCLGKDLSRMFTVTVSGSSITQSSLSNQFTDDGSSSANNFNMVYDNTNNIGYISYYNQNASNYPYLQTYTVSGNTFTFGTPVAVESTSALKSVGVAEGSADGNGVCVAWKNSSGIRYASPTFNGLIANVGTVNTVSSTTATVYLEGSQFLNYNLGSKTFIIAYQDTSGGKYDIIANSGTVSGGSITFGTYDIVFPTTNSSQYYTINSPTGINSNNAFIIQQRYNQSPYKTAGSIWGAGSSTTNLTSSNFIGFAENTVADNEDVKVKVISQTDENQTGLTTASQYYVQTDGTLSTTAGTPSVLGGTALSSTKILIKS